jgi:hypothetical protein
MANPEVARADALRLAAKAVAPLAAGGAEFQAIAEAGSAGAVERAAAAPATLQNSTSRTSTTSSNDSTSSTSNYAESPTDVDEQTHKVPWCPTIVDTWFSHLDKVLLAAGVAGVEHHLVLLAAGDGPHSHESKWLFQLLQELSSSDSAAGAGAALWEDTAALARSQAARVAAAAAGVGGGGGEPAAGAAAAGAASAGVGGGGEPAAAGVGAGGEPAAGAAAAGAASEAIPPSFLTSAISPAIIGDLLAAAALGVDAEVAMCHGRWRDGGRVEDLVGEWNRVLYLMKHGRAMVQDLQTTAAAVEALAKDLLICASVLGLMGLERSAGFCCNEPSCPNLEGLSEVGLVVPGVKGVPRREGAGLCGRCKSVCYCSKLCQKRNEDVHYKLCGLPLKQQRQAEDGNQTDERKHGNSTDSRSESRSSSRAQEQQDQE